MSFISQGYGHEDLFVDSSETHRDLLFTAVQTSNFRWAKYLLHKGADINMVDEYNRSCLHGAIENGFTKFIKYAAYLDGVNLDITSKFGKNLLMTAIIYNKSQILEILLKAGANPNARGVFNQTSIHYAVLFESCGMLKQLLKYGAEVNLVDCFNQSPLFIATCTKPDADISNILLRAGADVNFKTLFNVNILTEVVLRANILRTFSVIDTLIDYGININEKDSIKQDTALHKAALTGNVPVIFKLVERGADIEAVNVYGQTPLEVSRKHGNVQAQIALEYFENLRITKELDSLNKNRLK